MNFLRTVGLVSVAALVLAASASASTFTSPAGTAYTGALKAQSEAKHMLIHTKGGATITCETSSIEWKVESHGPSTPAKGSVTNLSFGSCGATVVSVLKAGSMEVHLGNPGPFYFEEVTWSGFEITIAGPFGLDCKYFFPQPTSIFMGGLTTSASQGGQTATLHLQTGKIPVNNSVLCPQTIEMTGSYIITSPDYLDLD